MTRPVVVPSDPASSRPRLAVCFAGGGMFGIAWHLAVLDALLALPLDVDAAPLVGTSAGAWAAPAARLGLGYADFDAIGDVSVPNLRPGALHGVAAELFGASTTVSDVSVAAVELPFMRRRIFDASVVPVADLAAASSAVPGLFAPHRVQGRWCIDGGVRSMASIDAVPAADLLVVSLPIAGGLFGPASRTLEVTSRRMVARWRRTHGGTSIVLRPSDDVCAQLGADPRSLFDAARARDVFAACAAAASRRLGARLASIGMAEPSTPPERTPPRPASTRRRSVAVASPPAA